jgi:UDP-glucose 4-epimerase
MTRLRRSRTVADMRVLLTGASGYLGLHLTDRLLRSGHAVTALVRSPWKMGPFAEHEALTIHHADLLDAPRVAEAVAGHDACVHAGFVWGDPEQDLDLLDTRAAARLFDAAGQASVVRTVVISSTAVHRPFSPEMREDDALAPPDVYGATKAAAELFLWSACATHGMQGVVLRPGPIVGPPAFPEGAFRSDRRIAAFVETARRGEPLQVVRDEGRQLVAATDVARAVAAAIESPDASGTYLCVDRALTTWESIARKAVEMTASSSEVVVSDAPDDTPPPRFRHDRITALLGDPLDSGEALKQHLDHLARSP